MRHKINRNLVVIAFLLMAISFSSCHKTNTSIDYNESIETIYDYVESQQMTNLVLNTYFKAITDSVLLVDGNSKIDSAKVSYSTNPSVITFEYPWDKDDGYGHMRKGKFEARTETSFWDSLAIINFTFTNFYYDYDSVTIERMSLTNEDVNAGNNFVFYVEIHKMQRVFHDTTGILTYYLQQYFTRIKDPSSHYFTTNDYFSIHGNLVGNDRNGRAFRGVVQDTNSLINSFSCSWIKSGISVVDLPTLELITSCNLSFSNGGECLNKYSATINGSLFVKAFD